MTFNYNFLAPPLLDAEVLEDFEEKKKVGIALVCKSSIYITLKVINPTFDIIMDHRFKQKKQLIFVMQGSWKDGHNFRGKINH